MSDDDTDLRLNFGFFFCIFENYMVWIEEVHHPVLYFYLIRGYKYSLASDAPVREFDYNV